MLPIKKRSSLNQNPLLKDHNIKDHNHNDPNVKNPLHKDYNIKGPNIKDHKGKVCSAKASNPELKQTL